MTHTYGQGTTATGRYGGSATHEQGSGSTSFKNAYGGSATHTYGEGTTATNRYGDTATHKEGTDYTTATNPYGGTATHTYGEGTTATTNYGATVYHAPYPAYHPPTTVAYYGSSCGDCRAGPPGAPQPQVPSSDWPPAQRLPLPTPAQPKRAPMMQVSQPAVPKPRPHLLRALKPAPPPLRLPSPLQLYRHKRRTGWEQPMPCCPPGPCLSRKTGPRTT
jgi:hypothetical protein